jgi:hypothetical protein
MDNFIDESAFAPDEREEEWKRELMEDTFLVAYTVEDFVKLLKQPCDKSLSGRKIRAIYEYYEHHAERNNQTLLRRLFELVTNDISEISEDLGAALLFISCPARPSLKDLRRDLRSAVKTYMENVGRGEDFNKLMGPWSE